MQEQAFRAIGPTTYLCPVPAVLVGCAGDSGWRGQMPESPTPNLITVAWTGICCTRPPMLSISVRRERYSYALLEKSREFTVNLVGEPLLKALDFCGVKSGRELDKFAALGLHALPAEGLDCAPALAEAPAYLSCKVRQLLPLGSHDLFLAEIVNVHVREDFFRPDGSIDEQAMKLVAYVHGKYRALGGELGFFGCSVASEDVLRKRMPKKTGGDKGASPAGAAGRKAAGHGGRASTGAKGAAGGSSPRRGGRS